jgi:hypothetical protein
MLAYKDLTRRRDLETRLCLFRGVPKRLYKEEPRSGRGLRLTE